LVKQPGVALLLGDAFGEMCYDSSGCSFSINQIEQMVCEGAPPGTNRSDVFHAIVGHYIGERRPDAAIMPSPEGVTS
jgi:hypothetical protein